MYEVFRNPPIFLTALSRSALTSTVLFAILRRSTLYAASG
jgi:hypothetical protein